MRKKVHYRHSFLDTNSDKTNSASKDQNNLIRILEKDLDQAEKTITQLRQERDEHNQIIGTIMDAIRLPLKNRSPFCATAFQKHLNNLRLSIEIKGLKDYAALCGFVDCPESVSERIQELEDQLKKNS